MKKPIDMNLVQLKAENIELKTEIKSLEAQIEQLTFLHNEDVNTIKLLNEQIKKMKCWCNCKNYISCLEDCCRKNISFSKGICYNCKKWEIKEK